ncbi:MAG: PEP-CTERM sorting domain-containing protein [Cyanobacteria bacterium J06633_8]
MSTSRFFSNSVLKAGVVSFISIVGSLAIDATPSKAATIDFSTWTAIGGVTGTGTTGAANLSTGVDPAAVVEAGTANGLEVQLGLSPNSKTTPLGPNTAGDLDFINRYTFPDNNAYAYEGSGIRNSNFIAAAGDVLTFDWNFTTTEPTPPNTNNDFAFYAVNGVVTAIPNADADNAGNSSVSIALANGINDIAIGIADAGDVNNESIFAITNADGPVQPIPEPLTILGSLGGLAFGSFIRKRLRQEAAE